MKNIVIGIIIGVVTTFWILSKAETLNDTNVDSFGSIKTWKFSDYQ